MSLAQAFALKVDPSAPAKAEEFRQDLNVRLTCPDCGDTGQVIEEFSSGDLVCGNCGACESSQKSQGLQADLFVPLA